MSPIKRDFTLYLEDMFLSLVFHLAISGHLKTTNFSSQFLLSQKI